jgi:hypothetical protein
MKLQFQAIDDFEVIASIVGFGDMGMAQAEAWAAADPVTFHDEVRYHICDLNGDPIRFDH